MQFMSDRTRHPTLRELVSNAPATWSGKFGGVPRDYLISEISKAGLFDEDQATYIDLLRNGNCKVETN